MSDSHARHGSGHERDPWGDHIRESRDVGDHLGAEAHGPRPGAHHGAIPRG